MGRNDGYYIDPLLSNVAVDYSLKIRDGLVGPMVFPRITVGKPSGQYAYFSAEDAYKVPDVTMAGERAEANQLASSAVKKPYATLPYGLKSFIDKAEAEVMEGPFRMWYLRKTEEIVGKLELAQEKRIASAILRLSGRSISPTKKWNESGSDPYTDIRDGVAKLFFRPNLMVMSESVFDAIEFHPALIAKLGEANMIKKVDETTLGKLFRIDRVVIARGRADFGKRNANKDVSITSIWGNSVVLAHTSAKWDEPCAGKTVAVKYSEADNLGYIVRSWDAPEGGLMGGEWVQVAHDVAEMVVCPELLYTVKDVL
ncbi:MAG: hypothetical protein LBL20_02780 [Treponema sp.]|jgi:hypothetical protein|nr:hypothetical protein [Treponema sp.]